MKSCTPKVNAAVFPHAAQPNRTAPHSRAGLRPALLIALLTALSSTGIVLADDAVAMNATPVAPGTVAADPLPSIQARWAEIRYQIAEGERVRAFESLLGEIGRAQQRTPEDLRLKVWKGIVLASQAGAQGGLGALSLCKQARKEFEAVIEKDGSLLDGSAYTSLGSLYYQVPGWPLGFGDDDKARALLQKGLAIAPEGIDANYFWADFLLDQKDYAGAVRAFEKALAAPPRPGREDADSGRRTEIETGLDRARAGLKG